MEHYRIFIEILCINQSIIYKSCIFVSIDNKDTINDVFLVCQERPTIQFGSTAVLEKCVQDPFQDLLSIKPGKIKNNI